MKTIDKLQSTGAVYRLNGIVECLDKKSLLDDEIDGLKQLKKDSTILAGRKISSYACAVLDLLEIEAYTGKDVDTKLNRGIKVKDSYMKGEDTKRKLLFNLDMMRKTDEKHPLNATQIAQKLEQEGLWYMV